MGNRAITEPLALTTDYVSIDGRYTDANGNPYASVAAAEAALGRRMNQYTVGLTVLVKESGWAEAKEYWVQPKGTTPVTYGLVVKGEDLTKALSLSGEQKHNASANINNRAAVVADVTGEVQALGYKVLSPNLSFAEQVTEANTIYEIKDSFDLNNGSVTIPANCTLKFNGGSIVDSGTEGRILGLKRIEITPQQAGCIIGDATNSLVGVSNSRQLLKLTEIDNVILVLDNDYSFSHYDNVIFNSLTIEGNGHTLYGDTGILFNVKNNITCRNVRISNSSFRRSVFQVFNLMDADTASTIILNGVSIEPNITAKYESAYCRLLTLSKYAGLKGTHGSGLFDETKSYNKDTIVRYKVNPQDIDGSGSSDQYFKFIEDHIGAWSYSDVVALLPQEIEAIVYDENVEYGVHDVVLYNNLVYMFIDKKTSGEWDSGKVVVVEYATIDYTKSINISVKNCVFDTVLGENGMVINGTDCLLSKCVFENNIVHNLSSTPLLNFGTTNFSIYSKIVDQSYNLIKRYFDVKYNTVYNDKDFDPLNVQNFPTAPTYYTFLVINGGECEFAYNKIYNLIVKNRDGFAVNRVYEAYLSCTNLIFEHNEITNIIKVNSAVELIKAKGSPGRKIIRYNVFKQESLPKIKSIYNDDNYWSIIYSECRNKEVVIENNSFDISNYYGLEANSNKVEKISFRNNNISIEQSWSPKEAFGRNSVYNVIYGIDSSFTKEWDIENNTVKIKKANPTINDVVLNSPTFVFDISVLSYTTPVPGNRLIANNSIEGGLICSHIRSCTIRDNKSYPYYTDIPKSKTEKYFQNMVLFTRIIDCVMSNNYIDLPYRYRFVSGGDNPVPDGVGATTLDYTVSLNETLNRLNTGMLFSNEPYNNSLTTYQITDEYGNNAVAQVLIWDNIAYALKEDGEIVSSTSLGIIGVAIATLQDTLADANSKFMMSKVIIRLGIKDAGVGKKYRIRKTRVAVSSPNGVMMLPKAVNEGCLPTDSKMNYIVGAKIYVRGINKYAVWNGSTWVDEKGLLFGKTNGSLAQRPNVRQGKDIGYNYFDNSLGKPIYWNGTAWIDANGDYIVDNSGTLQNRLALTSPVKGQQFKLTGGVNDVYLIYGDYGWLKATDGTPWFDDSGTLNAMYDKYNYTLLTEQPSDWTTKYNTYYKIVNGVYTLLTTLETWASDTYYKKDVNVNKGIQVKLTDTDIELLNKVVKWNGTKYINIVDNVALKAGTPIVTFTTENNTTTAAITSTSSGKIYYTKNGDAPTSSSTEYSSAITLADGDQVKAICIRDHMDNSAIGFVKVATPVVSFNSAGILAITCDTADAKIYYTTDGSVPSTASTEYDSSASVTIAKGVTVNAIAVLIGRVNSEKGFKKRS